MLTRRAALISMGVAAISRAAETNQWRPWSPRAEITPVLRQDAATGELIVGGGGNVAVNGGWERTFGGVSPGKWYRVTARYRGTGLTDAPRQVVARLEWAKSNGGRAGRPDYAYTVKPEGDWSLVTLEAPAPADAGAAKLQLLLLEAPNADVRWRDIQFRAIDTPTARNVKIATVRLRPRGADPVAKFASLVDRDVAEGTDIILLPEGVSVVGTGKAYADVAEPLDGPIVRRLADLARRKKAWLIAGVYERDGKGVYNTSVLLDRKGQLAGKYRKVYIPREEMEGGITAGLAYPVFDTDFGRLGMMICWDVQYADPARAMALAGAEMILMPIWGGDETLAKARAIENHLYLISSGYDFPSAIYTPEGTTLVREETDGRIAMATVDLSKRHVDEWLGHMRGRFHREVRSDVPIAPPDRR